MGQWEVTQPYQFYVYYGRLDVSAEPSQPTEVWKDYLVRVTLHDGVDHVGTFDIDMSQFSQTTLIGLAAQSDGSVRGVRSDLSVLEGHSELRIQGVGQGEASNIGTSRGFFEIGPGLGGGDDASDWTAQYLEQSSSGAENAIHWGISTSNGRVFLVTEANTQTDLPMAWDFAWKSNEQPTAYAQGQAIASSSISPVRTGVTAIAAGSTLNVGIGARQVEPNGFRGKYDELRIQAFVPSEAHRIVEGRMLANPTSWYGIGAEETVIDTSTITALPDQATTEQETPVTIDVLANDIGSGLTIDSATAPINGVSTINGDKVDYTPNSTFSGVDQFDYFATDGTKVSQGRVTVLVTGDTSTPGPDPEPDPEPDPVPDPETDDVFPVYIKTDRGNIGWDSGCWVHGGNSRLDEYESFVGRRPDCGTQSIQTGDNWWEMCWNSSAGTANSDFAESPGSFNPELAGLYTSPFPDWPKNIWGVNSSDVRQIIIVVCWIEAIPRAWSNKWTGSIYQNPTLWRDIMGGAADKYMFLLGRKWAFMDASAPSVYQKIFDLSYEFTLPGRAQNPEGSYTLNGAKRYTYQDFPFGWTRMARVFREGYKYQAGLSSIADVPVYFGWRPQVRYLYRDRQEGSTRVTHEEVFANLAKDWVIPNDVIIDGVTVLPAGRIGAQANLCGVSWHDSGAAGDGQFRGSSATAPNNTWALTDNGSPTHWGMNRVPQFCREQGVGWFLPEWSARGLTVSNAPSQYPRDFVIYTHDLINRNKDVMIVECNFNQGHSGHTSSFDGGAGQNPWPTYYDLWNNN